MLKFITSNKNKFKEVAAILSPVKVKQVHIDLEEIQDLDALKIIKHKLQQALKVKKGNLIVEDSSVYFGCLNNKLPGPFIKAFEQSLDNQEIYNLCKSLKDNSATARTTIGYAKDAKHIKFFEASIKGTIVRPKGKKDFGSGPVFKPQGYNQTYGEMERDLKNKISGRAKAIRKLKNYLLKNKLV